MQTGNNPQSPSKGSVSHPSVVNSGTDVVSCPRCHQFTGQQASKATSVNNGNDILCPRCGFDGLVKGSNV